MKVFNLCAKVTKRHLVSLGVYLGIFAVLAVMLTAFNNTSQSLSFEAVRPSAAIVNRDAVSYTHLDVYERQAKPQTAGLSR